MRLLILTQYYPPEVGAPQARLSELANRFAEKGHSVTVLTAMPNYPKGEIYPGFGGVFSKERTSNGIQIGRVFVYATKSAGFVPRMTSYLSFLASAVITGTFWLPRGDYLLVESPPLFLGIGGWWLALFKRAKLIFNVSDLWPESVVHLGKLKRGSAAHRVNVLLEEFCYRQSWMISGQSRGILQDIQARFPHKRLYHLSNGADPDLFHPSKRCEVTRENLAGIGRSLAVYAGLHGLAQGLDQIVRAAELLNDSDAITVVLIGDGPEKAALQAEVARKGLRHVRLIDAQDKEKMPRIVASADFALVPLGLQLPGAVPSKIYEAMASGTAVILVAQGEPAEIILEAKAGLVVETGDISGLARAMRLLSSDKELRGELGRNGRRAVELTYDRNNIVRKFMENLERDLEC